MRALFLALCLALASPAPAQEPDPTEIAWAEAQQQTLPALTARAEAARARATARAGWFEAEEPSFAAAFPRWAGAPLNRPAALRGRLSQLDLAEVERARERQAPLPELGSPERQTRLVEARTAALEAEAASDGLERRLLVEALAVLEAHPLLHAAALGPIRADWEAVAATEPEEGAEEEVLEAAQAAAARADGWLRELDRMVGDLVLHAVRGERHLDVAGRVESLSSDGEGAAVQLALLWSVAAGEEKQTLDAALASWWASDAWDAGERSAEALAARLQAMDGEAPWQAVRRTAFEKTLEARSGTAAEALPEVQADPADQARRAEEEAALAQAEAEAALAGAADYAARRRAEALRDLAAARQRTAELWGEAEGMQEAARALQEELDSDLTEIGDDIRKIEERRLGQSAPEPDAVYSRVRALSQRLRGGEVARGAHLGRAQGLEDRALAQLETDRDAIAVQHQRATEISEPVVQAEVEALLDTWREQLGEQRKAVDSLVTAATAERDTALRALSRLREHRKTLRSWVSASERYRDRGFLLKDVVQELSLLGPSLVMRVRARWDDVRGLPGRLTDFNLLRGLTGTLLWALIWVGVWLWARSQADQASRAVTRRLNTLRPDLRHSDLRNLEDPIERFLQAFVDLLLGWLLIGRIGALLPELGFVVLVYLQVALYFALLAAFDLLVVPTNQVRPALLILRKDPFALARRTVRLTVGLLIARSFVYRLLWDVLGLDVIAGLVGTGFRLAMLGLLVWALFRWEPHLRARVRKRNQDTPVVAFLARDPENPVVQPLRGAAILLFFLVDAVVEGVFWLARERSGVAWLMHAFSRFREDEEGPELAPIAPEIAQTIGPKGGPLELDRPEIRTEVGAAIEAWRKEARRGLVTLVGDRGCGKTQACSQVKTLLDDCELPHFEVRLTRQLVTEGDMLRWLGDVLELDEVGDADSAVSQLLEREARAHILLDIHRAWTRQVGGFEAVTTLLYILNATSHHHFWVLSMHRLSWDFFASSGSLVDVGVFRAVIPLQPLTAKQLRELCVTRTERAGYRLDTSQLMRNSAFGADPAVEEERGIHVFFRLLAEASHGNPTVALQLFVRCLHPTDEPEVLLVHAGDALVSDIIPGLTDAALFTLVALRIQDELGESELVEVTNLSQAVVRATLRDLISRGLVARERERMRIPESHLPAVTRTLRRRHFLHLGVP